MHISLYLIWFHEIHIEYVKMKSPRTIIQKNEFKRESSVRFVTDRIHIFWKNYKAKRQNEKRASGLSPGWKFACTPVFSIIYLWSW